jgi:small-conductance mechanosensitive channel
MTTAVIVLVTTLAGVVGLMVYVWAKLETAMQRLTQLAEDKTRLADARDRAERQALTFSREISALRATSAREKQTLVDALKKSRDELTRHASADELRNMLDDVLNGGKP